MRRNASKRFHILTLLFFGIMPILFHAHAGETVFPDTTGEMVLIPEGEFIMGGSEKYGRIGLEVGVDTLPERKVYLSPFYIDKYEVTVAQYKRFQAATGHPPPYLWGIKYSEGLNPFRDNDAMSDVSWHDADTYCKWVGKRLPTEEEWEKAARGTDGRRFPWGSEWKDGIANTKEHFYKDKPFAPARGENTVTEVGSMKGDVSPYGIYDMGGNVLEWTSSWYKPYPGNNLKITVFGEKFKVLKGGVWKSPAIPFSFAFYRHWDRPYGSDDPWNGVRCAKDAE